MYLPIVSLNRSQDVRIGNAVAPQLGKTKQTGGLFSALNVNLNDTKTRRDLQRHSAIGAYTPVGAVTTKYTDFFASAAVTVVNGTGLTVNVPAFTLASRLFPDQGTLAVPATTGVATPSSTVGDTIYLVSASNTGAIIAVAGEVSNGTPTYEVDTLTFTGTPTGGTFVLSFDYNGYHYVTAPITYSATAATLQTNITTALGNLTPTLPNTLTVGGTATAATLTASSIFEGPITNQAVSTALTGGTNPAATIARTTVGVGATLPALNAGTLPLSYVLVAKGATAPTAITNFVLTA